MRYWPILGKCPKIVLQELRKLRETFVSIAEILTQELQSMKQEC
jgi:hypothetical protein